MASPERLRHNLAAIHIEGLAFSIMVGVGESYLPAFVLTRGMGPLVAALVATLPILLGSLIQLLSPTLLAKIGSYRKFVIFTAALQAHITHKPYLEALGLEQPTPMKAGELWRALIEQVGWEHLSWVDTIELILNQGCLAERLKKVAGDHPDLRQLRQVYQQLAHSLASGKPFVA